MAPSPTTSPYLLLLPPPPQPSTRLTLNAAYRAPLTSILNRLKGTSSPSVLVIAITCPILVGPVPKSKSLSWDAAQSLLAGVYTLVSVISAELAVETVAVSDDAAAIDARVVLVDHERKRSYHRNFDGIYEANCTPVLDLAAFASTVYPWRQVFHPSTEAGYELLSAYLALAEGKQILLQNQIVAVEGGLSMSTSKGSSAATDQEHLLPVHNTVCLGGTFDHLHPGHKLLLHATALLLHVPVAASGSHQEQQAVLIVGISGDELLVKKKYAEELQSWDTRADNVLRFLSTVFNSASSNSNTLPQTSTPHPDERHAVFCNGSVLVRCVNIHDPFGPTIAEEAIDAIAVSGETRSGGQAINDRRTGKGWGPLKVYEIDVLDARDVTEEEGSASSPAAAENFSSKISSTAIRQRKADARNKE